jgi:hypothetical protein
MLIEEPSSHKKLLGEPEDEGRRLTQGEYAYSVGEIEIEDEIELHHGVTHKKEDSPGRLPEETKKRRSRSRGKMQIEIDEFYNENDPN